MVVPSAARVYRTFRPACYPRVVYSRGRVTQPAPNTHLWRLRKRGQRIDAELRDRGDKAGVEVQFFYNGAPTYRRVWPTRSQAMAEADSKRVELERSGWISHW
jgi:hypothetical protein